MAERIWNLEKEAHLLSGAERARLVIRDDHAKVYENEKGFLSPAEKQALLRMPDEEYKMLWEIYEQMPLTMTAITKSYLRFKYYYESLKKAHLLLNISPAVSYLSKLAEENIANEEAKRDALKIIDMLQVLETDSLGKPAFKDALSFIKEIVPKASEQARDFISIKKTVGRTNELMGFNVFTCEYYSESCQIYAEEISLCIKEHNMIMNKVGEGMFDLSSYLISEPTPESDPEAK